MGNKQWDDMFYAVLIAFVVTIFIWWLASGSGSEGETIQLDRLPPEPTQDQTYPW